MGLDMYLTKKIYVGAEYSHRKVTGQCEIFIDGKKLPINFNQISYIEEKCGYWRKANQIHKWFVDNVQDGVDNCGDYSVSEEQLNQLLEVCLKVKKASKLVKGAVTNGYTLENGVKIPNVEEGKEIKDSSVAEQLLPTASGFFFGGTDYDEYYMNDIDNTIEIINKILSEKEEGKNYLPFDVYYSSSW